MAQYAKLSDARRRDIRALAIITIGELHVSLSDADGISALARSGRRNPEADEDGPEMALLLADAMDEIAAEVRAGKPVLPPRAKRARPQGPALHELTPETRHMIEQTAIEEIRHFGAEGNPVAIERLAEAGRYDSWPTVEGELLAWHVSDAMDEMARQLRAGQVVMAGFAALGPVVRLMVRS